MAAGWKPCCSPPAVLRCCSWRSTWTAAKPRCTTSRIRHSHALERPEALLDPDAQAVGAELHVLGGLVRGHDPGILPAGDPEHDQGAAPLAFAEGPSGRHCVRPFPGHEAPGRPSAVRWSPGRSCFGHGACRDASPGGGRRPTGRGSAGPGRRARARSCAPASPAPTGPDAPGHGDGQAAAGHAHDQGHQLPALAVGSTARVSSEPCHQAGTQRSSGSKQASTPAAPRRARPGRPRRAATPAGTGASCASRNPRSAGPPAPRSGSCCGPGSWPPLTGPGPGSGRDAGGAGAWRCTGRGEWNAVGRSMVGSRYRLKVIQDNHHAFFAPAARGAQSPHINVDWSFTYP